MDFDVIVIGSGQASAWVRGYADRGTQGCADRSPDRTDHQGRSWVPGEPIIAAQ